MIANKLRTIPWHRWRELCNGQTLVTVLTLLMIAAFHANANEDRLLLNLYYIGIAAAIYALVKRGALVMTVIVGSVAVGTLVGNVYMESWTPSRDRILDPLLDFFGWTVLLLLFWRMGVDAYRIQAEQRRREIERQVAEQAVTARAAALNCAAHEIRTPLAAILTITETLMDETAGELSHVQREFLRDVDRCGKHLQSLVNDMLDYAKAQARQVKLAIQTVSLPDLIQQCVAIAEVKAQEQGVKIAVQTEPGVTEISADPLRLKQILLNLLSNAVKFTPEQGLVKLQARIKGSDVLIGVRDTGRGISEDKLAHLFEPYHQSERDDRARGTGLGLAITKFLVELHGGSISVDSSPGSGSLFTVRLPLRAQRPGDKETGKTWTEVAPEPSRETEELCEARA
jgi:signal transduction histidine kinase